MTNSKAVTHRVPTTHSWSDSQARVRSGQTFLSRWTGSPPVLSWRPTRAWNSSADQIPARDEVKNAEWRQMVAEHLRSIPETSATFTLNQMRGTPSFLLFDEWFGHKGEGEIAIVETWLDRL